MRERQREIVQEEVAKFAALSFIIGKDEEELRLRIQTRLEDEGEIDPDHRVAVRLGRDRDMHVRIGTPEEVWAWKVSAPGPIKRRDY